MSPLESLTHLRSMPSVIEASRSIRHSRTGNTSRRCSPTTHITLHVARVSDHVRMTFRNCHESDQGEIAWVSQVPMAVPNESANRLGATPSFRWEFFFAHQIAIWIDVWIVMCLHESVKGWVPFFEFCAFRRPDQVLIYSRSLALSLCLFNLWLGSQVIRK